MVAALVSLVGLCSAPAAAWTVAPSVATNPRGVNVVAGLHDTAVNSCDDSGNLKLTTPDTPLTQTQINAAHRSMNSPALDQLPGVATVRVTIPWDVADPGIVDGSQVADQTSDKQTLYGTRVCMDEWLKGVFGRQLSPEIDFRGDPYFSDASGQVLMPTLAQYKAAVLAFRTQYLDCGSTCPDGGRVRIIGPWNEPDNAGSGPGSNYDLMFPNGVTRLGGSYCPANPTVDNCGAVMAAQLWVTDYHLIMDGDSGGTPCSNCIVPAAIFDGHDGLETIHGEACPNTCPYIYLYNNSIAASGLHPRHWATHPYSDTMAWQAGTPHDPTELSIFAAKLQKYGYGTDTVIWINEVSVCDPGSTQGTCAKSIDPSRDKAAAMQYLLGTSSGDLTMSVDPAGPQVGRIDYFCFIAGEQKCNSDWALVDIGSTSLNAAGQVFATWANG